MTPTSDDPARQCRQEKMEALGKLAAGIAHDFSNHLLAMTAFAEAALRDAPPKSEQRHDLGRVLAATERAQALVRQILSFSRAADPIREPLRLGALLDECLAMIRPGLPANVEIAQNAGTGDDLIFADPAQTHSACLCLLANAGHAMREKGGVLRVGIDRAGASVRLTVCDSGTGMEPATLDRIFDPYFTTRAAGEGTGLGLATVRGIVEEHGGSVEAESAPGEGSTLRILLPHHHVADETPQKTPGGRVLYRECQPMLAKLGRRMIADLGYGVETFTSCAEAIEGFREDPDRFQLVLLDDAGEETPGPSLAAEVRAARTRLPIILCVDARHPVDGVDARALGYTALLAKPFSLRELAAALGAAQESADAQR